MSMVLHMWINYIIVIFSDSVIDALSVMCVATATWPCVCQTKRFQLLASKGHQSHSRGLRRSLFWRTASEVSTTSLRLERCLHTVYVYKHTCLSAISNRAFPVATSWLCNTLLQKVTLAPSLTFFRKRLKTDLFSHFISSITCNACAVTCKMHCLKKGNFPVCFKPYFWPSISFCIRYYGWLRLSAKIYTHMLLCWMPCDRPTGLWFRRRASSR